MNTNSFPALRVDILLCRNGKSWPSLKTCTQYTWWPLQSQHFYDQLTKGLDWFPENICQSFMCQTIGHRSVDQCRCTVGGEKIPDSKSKISICLEPSNLGLQELRNAEGRIENWVQPFWNWSRLQSLPKRRRNEEDQIENQVQPFWSRTGPAVSVIHHNHSIVTNLREDLKSSDQSLRWMLLTWTIRKRVCIFPLESSLASNWTEPLLLTWLRYEEQLK